MACNLTRSRAEACKDTVAGIKEVYFVDYDKLGTVTLTDDEVTDMTGDSSNNLTAFKYEVKGNNSFETNINASRENGTVFYEQVLNLTFKKLTKEDHKELKLLAAGRPHVFIVDRNDNVFLMGKEEGADVTAGTVSTGNALGDFNGYNLTFTANETSPPNFCDVDTTNANFPFSEFDGLSAGTITITAVSQV